MIISLELMMIRGLYLEKGNSDQNLVYTIPRVTVEHAGLEHRFQTRGRVLILKRSGGSMCRSMRDMSELDE